MHDQGGANGNSLSGNRLWTAGDMMLRVEGAGHASNLTHPEPVNRAIAGFLDSI